eukprot:TRINITY_DN51530_c0_g1_i1.p1 TRINITY_DN51530_c0_g1~~TRINITY_DN51530_c0_g1_i1.p1  ORF type:complete len:571 (-),score=42.15 TRINITY_DN51530_c0_g1_i1:1417-3051(-)
MAIRYAVDVEQEVAKIRQTVAAHPNVILHEVRIEELMSPHGISRFFTSVGLDQPTDPVFNLIHSKGYREYVFHKPDPQTSRGSNSNKTLCTRRRSKIALFQYLTSVPPGAELPPLPHLRPVAANKQLQTTTSEPTIDSPIKRAPKLAVLTQMRNCEDIIEYYLRSVAKLADIIVLFDDSSEDGTVLKSQQSLEKLNITFKILTKPPEGEMWDELVSYRTMTQTARDYGATHMAIIDTDEIMTGNLVADDLLKNIIYSLEPLEFLTVPLIHPLYSLHRYLVSAHDWVHAKHIQFAWSDDGKIDWRTKDKHHVPRIPFLPSATLKKTKSYIINSAPHMGAVHMKFVSSSFIRVKTAWYKHIEWEKNKERACSDFYDLKIPHLDVVWKKVSKLLWHNWFESYGSPIVFVRSATKAAVWRATEVLQLRHDNRVSRPSGVAPFCRELQQSFPFNLYDKAEPAEFPRIAQQIVDTLEQAAERGTSKILQEDTETKTQHEERHNITSTVDEKQVAEAIKFIGNLTEVLEEEVNPNTTLAAVEDTEMLEIGN